MPDPLLRVETRLVREGKNLRCTLVCVRIRGVNLLPLMPSGPVHKQPVSKAVQVTAEMLQAGKKIFSGFERGYWDTRQPKRQQPIQEGLAAHDAGLSWEP